LVDCIFALIIPLLIGWLFHTMSRISDLEGLIDNLRYESVKLEQRIAIGEGDNQRLRVEILELRIKLSECSGISISSESPITLAARPDTVVQRASAGDWPAGDIRIEFGIVPQARVGPDTLATISGRVIGLGDPHHFQVVLYAKTNYWYVQPFVAAPFTNLDTEGNWENQTHLGMEYAALLVRLGYEPPSTRFDLPPPGGAVLAVCRTPGR
jgi:hypothetical protein